MDVKTKLAVLADAAKYDASCASGGAKRKALPGGIGNSEGSGICHSYTPDGRCVSLLKILLTNFCIYDCSYCINRISSPVKRAKFTVDEVVQLTMDFYRRNYIEGLFLSSGVFKSSDETMEEMVDVARKLRVEHRFGGYIHLKAVAGCSKELLEKAGLYADRLSANIELPTQAELDLLAPAKTHLATE
ncbi:MAG: biotin synthase, partial [Proteobacteria bacterium]